jgi:carbonic anhydrase
MTSHSRPRALLAALVVCLYLPMALSRPVIAADSPKVTAEASLKKLKDGNARFAADVSAGQPINRARRATLAAGQTPFATVLSCADSRVPPEIVFNTGLGDLFVVRAAGQVADTAVLASVEYAAEHLHTPLLVVMGHESCGAVKAALERKDSMGPNLDFLLEAIQPAVERTKSTPERDRLKSAVMANVQEVVSHTLDNSEILQHLVQKRELTVVGAYYELASGIVTFSQPLSGAPAGPATGKPALHK